MRPTPPPAAPAPRRRGFTLIEVLLATFIIALGVLGLLALFAGAARQQQASNQGTLALFSTSSAETRLVEAFGTLSGAGADPCQPALLNFTPDRWVRLFADTRRGVLLAPTSDEREANQTYFLAQPSVSLPRVIYTAPPPPANESGTDPVDEGFLAGQRDGAFAEATGGSDVLDLGQIPIEPGSLAIEVATSFTVDSGGGVWTRVAGPTYQFSRIPDPLNQGSRSCYPSDQGNLGRFVFTLNGNVNQDPGTLPPGALVTDECERNWIIVDCATDGGTAEIFEMHIGAIRDAVPEVNCPNATESGFPSARVESITIVNYRERRSNIVSVADRTLSRLDETAPGGRRPDQAYSVLYRRGVTASQAMVVTYQLTPASSAAVYTPPERPSDLSSNRGPIRRVSLELRQNPDTEEYFVRTDSNEDQWALEPGQILVAEYATLPLGGGNAGSDTPVRVLRKVREVNSGGDATGWIGILDRAPRARNQNLKPRSVASVRLDFFAVADAVESLEDGSLWKLTPIDARIVQVSSRQ
ncbi:MAG: prepilin-type N-terminal cleavage/methylation domain-containing protein [Planctomycetota bacterium]|nr:prepilin-type N-terminal cleavage/methylation domain-containing protein [Planctomycetota bacterium]